MTEKAFLTSGLTDTGQRVEEFQAPQLGDDDYADHTAKMTANALDATGLIEIVEVQAGPGKVNLLGRVKQENERVYMDKVVDPILDAFFDCNADGFVGKQFFKRKKGGPKKYGWVISFGSESIRDAANMICQAIEESVPRLEVMEAPLVGPATPQSGGQRTGRKGASTIGAGG